MNENHLGKSHEVLILPCSYNNCSTFLSPERSSTLDQEACQIYTQPNGPHTDLQDVILEETRDISCGSVNTALPSPQPVYLILDKMKTKKWEEAKVPTRQHLNARAKEVERLANGTIPLEEQLRTPNPMARGPGTGGLLGWEMRDTWPLSNNVQTKSILEFTFLYLVPLLFLSVKYGW